MSKRKYCMLGRVERRKVLLKKLEEKRTEFLDSREDFQIPDCPNLTSYENFSHDNIFEVNENNFKDENELPSLRKHDISCDDFDDFFDIMEWPIMSKADLDRHLRSVNRHRNTPISKYRVEKWKESYQTIPLKSSKSCQWLDLKTMLGWILSIPAYFNNHSFRYEESDGFGNKWNTEMWKEMESANTADHSPLPISLAIDGLNVSNSMKVTKLSFTLSGLPRHMQEDKKNWFLWGIYYGHDGNVDNLREIADIVRSEVEPLQSCSFENRKYSVQLLSILCDSPVATRACGGLGPSTNRPCWRCFVSRENCWEGGDCEDEFAQLGLRSNMRGRVEKVLAKTADLSQVERKLGQRKDPPRFPVVDPHFTVQPCLLHIEDLNNIKHQVEWLVNRLNDLEIESLDRIITKCQKNSRRRDFTQLRTLKSLQYYRGVDFRCLLQLLPLALTILASHISTRRQKEICLAKAIRVLFLHSRYVAILYQHEIKNSDVILGQKILHLHNELAHQLVRNSRKGLGLESKSTLQHHLPFELLRGVPRCGIPRLNSTQASESHHQFLKSEFEHVFQGQKYEQKVQQVLRRHSFLLNISLQKLRATGFKSNEKKQIAAGDDIAIADDSRMNFWFARVHSVEPEKMIKVKWYELTGSSKVKEPVRDLFRYFTLNEYVEPMLQQRNAVLRRITMLRIRDIVLKNAEIHGKSIYVCNTACFGLRTSFLSLPTLNINIFQNE